MKNFAFFFISAFCLFVSNARSQSYFQQPGAQQPTTLKARLNAAFLMPYKDIQKRGSMIMYPTPDGLQANAFFIPSDKPSDMVLFVFHEWWGLNDNIKREATLWHKLLGGRVSVYALDMYDGHLGNDPAMAENMMRHVERERSCSIINGALAHIGKNKHVATLGWGMGGTWAFNAAILADIAAVGCVMYYGFPESDFIRVRNLSCDVLYIRADKDKLITLSEVHEFEKKVQTTDKNVVMVRYPTGHAFANPTDMNYDPEYAEEARNEALKFFKTRYGIIDDKDRLK
jgi:carboxymethylenebutenolidase